MNHVQTVARQMATLFILTVTLFVLFVTTMFMVTALLTTTTQ
jgi:hypothetical protein